MSRITDGDNELPSSLAGEVKRWEEMQERKKDHEQRLKDLLGSLQAAANPLYVCQLVVQRVSNIAEDELGTFTTTSDLASQFRDSVAHVQGLFNKGADATERDMQEMVKEIGQLWTFLESQKAQYPKGDGPLSGTSIKGLLDAIVSIEKPFNDEATVLVEPLIAKRQAEQTGKITGLVAKTTVSRNTWGKPQEMLRVMQNWDLQSVIGKASPELKAIYSGFQTLNQTVSSVSATTNISIQYKSEEIKSYLGEQNSMAECLARLVNAIVRNQKSG